MNACMIMLKNIEYMVRISSTPFGKDYGFKCTYIYHGFYQVPKLQLPL